MGILRYSINVTLDGCCDHRAFMPDERVHQHAADTIAEVDALLLGRTTYAMMEEAWRVPADGQPWPEWMEPWMEPFARTIDAARKYVVSSTLDPVDWNAERLQGDLELAVHRLKADHPGGLLVGGLQLARALAGRGLIDQYELVVHPRIVGHGPTLFAGLPREMELEPTDRIDLGSGVAAMRYRPVR